MKHLLNNLSEEEKNRIREQHEGGIKINTDKFKTLSESKMGNVKPLINEQSSDKDLENVRVAQYRGGGEGTQGVRDKVPGEFRDIVKDFKIPGGMFLNGIEKINTNSPEFVDALNKIKNVINNTSGKIDIDVQGGASAVGSSRGYDNKGLANKRRDNFIYAIQNSLGNLSDRINFVSKDGIVGKSTVKNSPEANTEQFVKISYPDKLSVYNQKLEAGRESTDVAKGRLRGKDVEKFIPNPEERGNPYMIVKVFYRKGEKETYKQRILDATGSPARELINYDAVKNCDLKFI